MSAVRRIAAQPVVVVVALVLGSIALPVSAQICTVPGTHATIQEAIDDPACTTVNLEAQTYPESIVIPRSLTLAGPGTGGAVVRGLVLISGAATEAALQDLGVENGCRPDALRTSGGARMLGENLQVERDAVLPCPLTADAIFANGFESGNTTAWSGTTPSP
jgi:hypothetical protein